MSLVGPNASSAWWRAQHSIESLSPAVQLESMSAHELLETVATLAEIRGAVDALSVMVAGALHAAARDPDSAPVVLGGHRNAASRLSEVWRIPMSAAHQLTMLGSATRSTRSLLGEAIEPEYPAVAAAIGVVPKATGETPQLSVDQAAVIVRELQKAQPRCSRDQLATGEQLVVTHAPPLTVEQTRRLAAEVRDRIDEAGIEPREETQRRRRSLTVRTTRDGLTHLDWYLDPESAGFVVSAIDAGVGAELRTPRFVSGGHSDESLADDGLTGSTPDMPDPRTLAQLRSDAATEVFRHLAGCVGSGFDRPPVTMIVRVSLDQLRDGVGTAEIDGVRSPISAKTARRLAVDANIIPAVLGAESEVLDLGRRRRLFSLAQRRALAERDDGCAWAGCPHPPGYTEAHHIRWWERDAGPTDLDNGVLLCTHHHHRVHADGWQIRVRKGVPWFTPPRHIDLRQRPRRGGRVRTPT